MAVTRILPAHQCKTLDVFTRESSEGCLYSVGADSILYVTIRFTAFQERGIYL